MILNNLVFPIKLGAKFVEGSIPTGYLTANDINKDMVYVISPEVGATNITLTLQNSKQSEKEVRAFMKPSNISVDMLVSKDESYYDLIKDWNVWQCFLPSKALAFVSYNRANQIGISFGFRQATVPRMEGFNFIDNITSSDFIPNKNGYYINKTALYIYNDLELTYNDVLIKQGNEFLVRKAIITSINTSTLEYDVDPSVYDSDIETIDIGIVESLILQANGILDDINFINFRLNDIYTKDETYNKDEVYNKIEIDSIVNNIYYEIIRLDKRIDELQDDMSLLVKVDEATISRNELNELRVSEEVISDINSRTKNTDFAAYQQLVQDFLNGKLDKKPDGIIDLITPLNKIDARYLDIDTELFIVVLSLPAIGIPNKIYLVPKSESETQNLYDEFIYLENKWEKLGTITIDLSNYYNKQDIDALLNNKVDKVSGKGLSTNDFTNTLKDKLEGIDISQLYGSKNLASPDLTGKEYVGNGVYNLGTIYGVNRVYNVYSGINTYNGVLTGDVVNLDIFTVGIGSYTFDLTYLSGRNTSGRDLNIQIINDGSFVSNTSIDNGSNLTLTYNFTGTSENEFRIVSVFSGSTYEEYQFKLQIEKGLIATPYTLPTITTPEYIRQTQTPRLIYSNSGTSNGTDITFSYVDSSMKVGDVYKVHSQLTYDNAELTQREVNDLIISDTVNNNIEKNHYAKTQHSAITKINYDFATKTITMIGDFNTGDSSNSFNIRLYKVGY